MKFIKISISIIAFISVVNSCNKNDTITMRWDQTGCFNPWDDHIHLDTFSTEAYHQGVYDFLKTEGIEVNSVSSEFDSTKIELCYACHCKTGEVILINIPKKDKRKLKKIVCGNQFDLKFY